jgi:sterol desaturase/sphingolipid hydroxylase (fatty acid hydroxylase superfamily)
MADALTASSDAIPRRNPDVLTLADVWRSYIRRPSPPMLGAALLIAVVLRVLLGDFAWQDAVMVAGILALTPPIEWAIHVYVLHARPLRIAGHELDLLAAQEHRAHHSAPAKLDGVLIPAYGVVVFTLMIAATVYLVSFVVHFVLGGDRLAYAATGLVMSYAVLASYEWCHYLIHTPYRPHSRYYRSIWRGHRLHHYKNEHYWFGVTSTVGDRMLGTAPEQTNVPRSATARTLGVDVP